MARHIQTVSSIGERYRAQRPSLAAACSATYRLQRILSRARSNSQAVHSLPMPLSHWQSEDAQLGDVVYRLDPERFTAASWTLTMKVSAYDPDASRALTIPNHHIKARFGGQGPISRSHNSSGDPNFRAARYHWRYLRSLYLAANRGPSFWIPRRR